MISSIKIMTLKAQLIKYFKEHSDRWVHKGELLKTEFRSSKGIPFMSDTVATMARKLQRDSIVAVQDDKYNKSIEYKWIPLHLRASYIPVSDRKGTKLFITNDI
jgi:hypothetical protein